MHPEFGSGLSALSMTFHALELAFELAHTRPEGYMENREINSSPEANQLLVRMRAVHQ